MPFIIANESFEKVASYGLIPNMIVYLMKDYKMSLAKGQNLLFLWTAATNFLPLIGAFVADSYLGRFLTIGFGSIISLLLQILLMQGVILLWLTTMIPQAKPPPCNPLANNCQSPTAGQYTLLVSALLLMSIGAGGVRPCSQAFGADQVDQRENPKNRRILETFFNWYYACACLSVVIALTVIVYIQDHLGWRTGFGIPAILMFLSALSFFLASPFYVMNKVKRSLFTGLVQAAVAAFRNRKVSLPPQGSSAQYYQRKDSTTTVPSDRLRYVSYPLKCLFNAHSAIGFS
ncbi:Protein NRT1/ PTR FAMILY 1.2 [Bienertia sinuspersici]